MRGNSSTCTTTVLIVRVQKTEKQHYAYTVINRSPFYEQLYLVLHGFKEVKKPFVLHCKRVLSGFTGSSVLLGTTVGTKNKEEKPPKKEKEKSKK